MKMTTAIRHRGPDGDGHYFDGVAALGHRRLAIIDLSTGDQPMANEQGNIWIVFNGEIYNYRELRAVLVSRGHTFRTTSDTETILHAYEEYGTDCVSRLEGMFSFAVYERDTRQLFLARDRVGKKPLLYATLGNVFHFGSEIKSFYPSPEWDGTIDVANLESYLSLGYFVAPQTVYRHVRKLEPGHWLRVSAGVVQTAKYWDVEDFDSDNRSEAVILKELEEELQRAVSERLMSEVPLGAFLSGGIDSGLVVSLMAEASPQPPVTTSVGFGEDKHNELTAAAVTAGYVHASHHSELITPKLEHVLDPIVMGFDEPFADSSAIPTWYVSRAARRQVKVALSGDGGDELFSGYDFRYRPLALEEGARRVVRGRAAMAVARCASLAWPKSPRLPRALRLATILDNLGRDPADAYYSDLCFLKPSMARQLLGRPPITDPRQSPVYESVVAPFKRCTSTSLVQRAQYADLKVYLPNDPLVKVDRMSMQHSLEVRCPLLDRRLVEFAFRLPTKTKMPHLRGKHLLRTLALRRLPQEISRLPKKGFEAPVGNWLMGPYAQSFESDVLASSAAVGSLLDLRVLRRWHGEHKARRADYSYGLWAAWVLSRWLEHQSRGH